MIAKSTSPGTFRYGHLFQRGDLPIYITDVAGNPLSPYKVTYQLLVTPKNARGLMVVGPCHRTPVKADEGEYYATGYAGECSQPGQWFIRWFLQEYFEAPLTTADFGFAVFNPADFHVVQTHCRFSNGCHRQCHRCHHNNAGGW